MNLTLGAALLSQGISILLAAVRMNLPQIIGLIGTFAVLSVLGARLTFVLLQHVVPESGRAAGLRHAA